MATVKYIFLIAILSCRYTAAQPPLQDSTLNNLIYPSGYSTCKLGELGAVKKAGDGKQAMILIPGLGFGGNVFESFMQAYRDQYVMYAVTPAGFDGTSAPPMPDTAIKYSALTWTNGIVKGVIELIEKEKLDKPVIIAHFVTGTQVALNLALSYPDKIGKVIIIGGSPYRHYASRTKEGTWDWNIEKKYTPEERGNLVEAFWAPKWFKTVTKKTWDSNMWTHDDYCKDSTIGKQLFKASADVPLQVMIRYLIEWMAYDISDRYKDVKVPMLILIPDFKGMSTTDSLGNMTFTNPMKQYLKYFHQEIVWAKARASGNQLITMQTIPDTRIFMWYDNPEATHTAIRDFIK